MTQEDKELLLKDLCVRLPYGIMVLEDIDKEFDGGCVSELVTITEIKGEKMFLTKNSLTPVTIEEICPYLRPMSSMTEEEFEKLKEYSGLKYEQLDLASYQNGTYKCLDFYLSEVPSYVVILVFDWLNAHHFDYRGLIEKGLAIEVTEENNPYERK